MVGKLLFYHYAIKFQTIPLPRQENKPSFASSCTLGNLGIGGHISKAQRKTWRASMDVSVYGIGQTTCLGLLSNDATVSRFQGASRVRKVSIVSIRTGASTMALRVMATYMTAFSRNRNSNTSQNGDLTIQNRKRWCLDTAKSLHEYYLGDK